MRGVTLKVEGDGDELPNVLAGVLSDEVMAAVSERCRRYFRDPVRGSFISATLAKLWKQKLRRMGVVPIAINSSDALRHGEIDATTHIDYTLLTDDVAAYGPIQGIAGHPQRFMERPRPACNSPEVCLVYGANYKQEKLRERDTSHETAETLHNVTSSREDTASGAATGASGMNTVGNRGRKRKHRRRNEGNPPARREEYGDPDNIGMSTEEAKAEVATVEELGPASTSSMIEFLSSQDFCCGDDGGFVSEDGLWGATDTSAVAELVGVYGGGGTKSSAVSTSAVDIAASVSLPTTTDLSTGRRTGPPLFRVVGTSTADAPSGEDISRAEGDVAWENIEVSIDPLDDPTSAIAEPEMFVIGRRGATRFTRCETEWRTQLHNVYIRFVPSADREKDCAPSSSSEGRMQQQDMIAHVCNVVIDPSALVAPTRVDKTPSTGPRDGRGAE